MDMLTEKYSQKAELKKDELDSEEWSWNLKKKSMLRRQKKKGKARAGNARKEGNSQPFERRKRRENMFIALASIFHCMFSRFVASKPIRHYFDLSFHFTDVNLFPIGQNIVKACYNERLLLNCVPVHGGCCLFHA